MSSKALDVFTVYYEEFLQHYGLPKKCAEELRLEIACEMLEPTGKSKVSAFMSANKSNGNIQRVCNALDVFTNLWRGFSNTINALEQRQQSAEEEATYYHVFFRNLETGKEVFFGESEGSDAVRFKTPKEALALVKNLRPLYEMLEDSIVISFMMPDECHERIKQAHSECEERNRELIKDVRAMGEKWLKEYTDE